MSVGHVARVLESAGIPTVIIAVAAFRRRLGVMKPPRVLLTPHLMGRPLGPPNHPKRQRDVLMAALKLLIDAPAGNQIEEFSGQYGVLQEFP